MRGGERNYILLGYNGICILQIYSCICCHEKKNPFVVTKKTSHFLLKSRYSYTLAALFLVKVEVRPNLEVLSSDKGRLKIWSGLRLTWQNKKPPEPNYAPYDTRDSCFACVQVIQKIGGSIGMAPEKASRTDLRAIRRTRNLFHCCRRDLKKFFFCDAPYLFPSLRGGISERE